MKSVAIFGDARTGKSSLLARFFGQPFEEDYKPTVDDCYWSEIYCGEKLCHINIIDTSGSFEFPAMDRLTMEKTDSFIFVYSIEDPKSFETMRRFIRRLGEIRDVKSVPTVVVCNKADLNDDINLLRELQMKIDKVGLQHDRDSVELCSFINETESLKRSNLVWQRKQVLELGCKFLLTSAKLRWNVNRIFYELFADPEVGIDLPRRSDSSLNEKLRNTIKSVVLKKVYVS